MIDLRALKYNIAQIRRLLPPAVDILAVVKANAYGHGAIEVARINVEAGAAMLGVALVEEGIELRNAGITTPILVQCCAGRDEIQFALENELILTVPSLDFARAVSAIAARLDRKAIVHMDIDTGMGRIGFAPKSAVDEIVQVSRLSHLAINGMYTHFCTSEIEDDPGTVEQLKQFEKLVHELALRGVKPAHIHAANSGAILNYSRSYLTLVRPGLILYGVYPHNVLRKKLDLRSVLRFETAITFLKTISAGTTLGYGRTFTAPREMKVATLNVGYADGYPWRLSNRAFVLVRGQRAPVLGRVSMDQTLIDVSGIPGVEVGEKVVLLGQDGSSQITAEDLAEWASTIPYEILCGISKRVPRVYAGGGDECLNRSKLEDI
jgi:alanine racemase